MQYSDGEKCNRAMKEHENDNCQLIAIIYNTIENKLMMQWSLIVK